MRAARPGRRAAGRRQGSRDRPDRRLQGAAVLGSRGGTCRAGGGPDRWLSRCGNGTELVGGRRRPAEGTPALRDHRLLHRHAHARRRATCSLPSRTPATATSSSGQAFKAGAAAAIVSRTATMRAARRGALLRVDDPLRALEGDRARAARIRANAKIVAVTGSVGKTGTKEMLRLCLAQAGATHAAEKSYNNHWGVPLTLARMPEDAAVRRVRDRHEPCGRDRAAGRDGAPARGASSPRSSRCTSAVPLGGGDRRGQGRDPHRAGARRHGRPAARQSRTSPAARACRRRSAPGS